MGKLGDSLGRSSGAQREVKWGTWGTVSAEMVAAHGYRCG